MKLYVPCQRPTCCLIDGGDGIKYWEQTAMIDLEVDICFRKNERWQGRGMGLGWPDPASMRLRRAGFATGKLDDKVNTPVQR